MQFQSKMWKLTFYFGISNTSFSSGIQLILFDEKNNRYETFPFAVIHPKILYTLIKVDV